MCKKNFVFFIFQIESHVSAVFKLKEHVSVVYKTHLHSEFILNTYLHSAYKNIIASWFSLIIQNFPINSFIVLLFIFIIWVRKHRAQRNNTIRDERKDLYFRSYHNIDQDSSETQHDIHYRMFYESFSAVFSSQCGLQQGLLSEEKYNSIVGTLKM